MSVEKKQKRRKKRGVTRTYVDEYGRVRVTKFKKKESRFKNPLRNVKALKPKRLPTTITGTGLMLYGAAAQAYSKNATENYFGPLATPINSMFDSMDSITKLFLAGVVGVGLSVFLGYALITQGIYIKKYGIPFRQLTSVFVAYLVLSSIISPFINNPGDIRQISDDKFSDRDTSGLSVEGLDSPFYDSFKDSLTDLFKNKIPPNLLDDIYLNLTAPSGYSLDPQRDAYLIKWKTEEKWDPVQHTFVAGDTANILDFINRSDSDFVLGQDTAIKFRAQSAFFTIGSSYSGQLLAPWNSEIGSALQGPFRAINDPDGPGYNGTNEDVTSGTPTIYNSVNLDPNIALNLKTSGAKGAIEYDAFWVAENKTGITSNSIRLKDKIDFITSIKGQFDYLIPNGFFDVISDPSGDYTGIDAEWGRQSLPADYLDSPDATDFIEQMERFRNQTGGENATFFSVAAAVTNFIQSKILDQMLANPNFLDVNQDFTGGAGDRDPAFFFYQAVKPNSNLQWGVTDIMPAYINMLRMLGVPARMVTGFAGGNIVGNTLQFSLNNILLWAEVLIPWESNGQKHLSWAMFNPSPIPSLFKDRNIITYGRNALGGESTIKVSIDSGEEIADAPAKLQYMGEKFKFSANVMYENTPAVGVSVSFNLLDSTELATLQTTGIQGTSIPGTPLGTYSTNESGWVTVSADVDFNGFLQMDQNPSYTATVSGVDLTAFTQGDQAGANAYAIVAIVGFSFGANVTGWLKNGTLTVSSTLDPVTLPGVDAVGYVSAPYQDITIRGLLQNTNRTTPIAGENLNFYILDKTAFDSLDFNNPDLNVLMNETMITRVSGGTNPNPLTTASDGTVSFTINFDDPFDTTPGTDDLYFVIAMWEGSLVISDPIAILITLQSSMTTTAKFPSGVPIVTTTTPGAAWEINTTAVTNTVLISQPAPLEGIEIFVLAVDKFDYDALGNIVTYSQFDTQVLNGFTEGSNMYKLHDTGTYSTIFTGSRITNANGLAAFTISVNGANMKNGYYYLFVYSTELQKFNQVYNGSSPFLFAKTDGLPVSPASLEDRGSNQLQIATPESSRFERLAIEFRRVIR